MQQLKVLILHGPNLNLLGSREPETYGAQTLADINTELVTLGKSLNTEVSTYQSNHEGKLIDRLHQAGRDALDGIIINPAAYTHTSIALRDALLAIDLPFIEVHLSNVYQRESFRHQSFLSDVASGVITGFGNTSYTLALRGLIIQLQNN